MAILDAVFRNALRQTITEKLALMADNGKSGNCGLLRNCYTARTRKTIGRKKTQTEQGDIWNSRTSQVLAADGQALYKKEEMKEAIREKQTTLIKRTYTSLERLPLLSSPRALLFAKRDNSTVSDRCILTLSISFVYSSTPMARRFRVVLP
ncbi:hypothetical protein TNIN_255861 [Trichonephila inaurata madagascariensis]|uniref:Uncharacterized protein n=1 Tax=Trichonephila inaurata madagascariensis TaxID=2747483 RepID=A0A8X6MMD4_9ARAC|nr:hypothetical protein TNIN_255861 [Trichonephila inaurata madagascariensis]